MKYIWSRKEIRNAQDAQAMLEQFKIEQPTIGALDTETSGLHIIQDKPFIIQFGWINETGCGYSYGIDLEQFPKLAPGVIKAFLWMAQRLQLFLGHNLKFDLHMLLNIGYEYRTENMSDTTFYIRYGHDAVSVENGGPPLKLKDYCARYVDPTAKMHEALLDSEKTQIAARYNKALVQALGMRLKDLDLIFGDPILGVEDLTEAQQKIYYDWLRALPAQIQRRTHLLVEAENIPYNMLNREHVMTYALNDIVLTLELYAQVAPVLAARLNQLPVNIENKQILPLLDMERVGFNTDTEYLEQSRQRLKAYILERRKRFHELGECTLKIGQHAKIKEVLQNVFSIDCVSTNAESLSRIGSEMRHNNEPLSQRAADYIDVLQELRTLEKWYATYIIRFQKNLTQTNRLYTTINQVGTVSGRVTSDFQQFPKDAITSVTGEELFNPRQMVRINGGDYDSLVYLDYSQIELRLQAMYTILVKHPDTNLCRAYMPYDCIAKNGEAFDFRDPAHIRRTKEDWFLAESPETKWVPVDVHAATTCLAFDITPEHPDFHKLRYHGKRINFAKNYGAQFTRIKQMFPEYTDAQITVINDAYYKAFPGVKQYHRFCYNLAAAQSYCTNLFGVRYYGVSGHNMINILIQGSGAFFLKLKIRQLWEYAQAHGIKSRFQMEIHDELSWEKHKDEADVFFEYKKIMEDWEDTLVPIVAEMEVSFTTWSAKKPARQPMDLILEGSDGSHTHSTSLPY